MKNAPVRVIVICTALLCFTIMAGTGLFLSTLRDRVLAENGRELANTALILARQTEAVFNAVEDVHQVLLEQLAGAGDLDEAERDRLISRHEMHLKLRDKAVGMPFVGSFTVVDSKGSVLNFSRQWPVPKIDVSDRDFFKAFQADPELASFISEPVPNRATGTWVVHLARKVSGPNGEFRGLVSAAMELRYFQDFFSSISLAPGSSIALFRRDSTLLVRHPRLDTAIGRRFPDAVALKLVSNTDNSVGMSKGELDGTIRLMAARRVGAYPVVITANKEASAVLAEWRRTATYLAGIATLTIVATIGIAFLFIRLFGHHQALTRARAEQEKSEQMREQSRRFDVALTNMSQGLCMFDAEQRLIICNKRYVDLYELTEDQTRPGTTLRAILEHRIASGNAPEDHETYINDRISEVTINKPYQVTNTLKDGRYVSVVHQPMAGGGWVATHEDITDIRRAESERAGAIADAQLFQARELAAQAANQAKSSFLAVMSHEIRTPMNAVIGLSSVLLESRLNDEQRQIADTIHNSSNNLLSLLNDILDVSKLDAGKVEFESTPFSLKALIHNVTSIVEASATEKGLRIRSSLDAALPAALNGDQGRISQVLLNLVANAIKFTDAGSVEISARCLKCEQGKATIACAVTDTGIGIAPDQIAKLFNDFAQADSSISRRFGGTGLGLAISKRIVEQMGGEIHVKSVVGAGATFQFTLALPIADLSPSAGQQDGAPRNDDTALLLARLERPLQVLLAEDNATNQLVFSKLMQGFNVDITIATNGRNALEQASAREFDIVFMDMRMPVMDGLEATWMIRALGGAWARIPIVALTANAFDDDAKACRDAGMDEFMSKPLRKKVLVEKLGKLLAHHPLLVQAAQPKPPGQGDHAGLPVTPAAEVGLTDVAPAFNLQVFRSLVAEIELDGVSEMYELFVAETAERLALLRRLSCQNDRERIRDEAHTLKGAAATVGMPQVAELAQTLEDTAHTIALDDYNHLNDRLASCFALARQDASAALKAALTGDERSGSAASHEISAGG